MLLAVLDTETTGLSDPEIVEFAMVVVNTDLEVIATYSSLIKPSKPIEPGAANVHGITDAHVQNAKTWAEYADENPEMVEHLKTAVLSGHNIRSFDIKRVMSKHYPELVHSQMLDTLEVARRVMPKGAEGSPPNHKLGTLAEHLGLPAREAHRALSDVETCVDFIQWLCESRKCGVEDLVAEAQAAQDKKVGSLRSAMRPRK